MDKQVRIHPTADVSPNAQLGDGTKVWNNAQIREGVIIGANCNIGSGAYIDFGVRIGDNVKIQNNALLFHGLVVGSGVFIGPGVIFVNDKYPRAIRPDGQVKTDDDWELGQSKVADGASVGAGSVVNFDVELGQFSLVGAGSNVTRSVPDFGLVAGNPARLIGFVCRCGERLKDAEIPGASAVSECACGLTTAVDAETWRSVQ